MDLDFRITGRIAHLYNGRRSFYASIGIGKRTIFLSRWDTARVDARKRGTVQISRGPIMTWYAGMYPYHEPKA
jgi:hypothetical protein